MIPSVANDKQIIESMDMMFSGCEVSWAGEGAGINAISLGTADGKIFCRGELSQGDIQRPIIVGKSGAAINGVAFNGNLLGVSTPDEIVIIRDLPLISDQQVNHAIIDRGAHTIVATPSGNFIAPIGKDGLLYMEPREDVVEATTVELKGNPFSNYMVAVMGDTHKGECFASVLRQDGLSAMFRDGDSWSGSRWTFSNLDIVDVAPIASPKFPHALAVLGIDNSIHFVRDVLTDRKPRAFRFAGLSGKAYRLLYSEGHVFILTSKCLYIFVNLANRFLNDAELDAPLTVAEFPCEAVDVNLAFDRDLLLLLVDRLKIISVAQFSDPRIHDASRKIIPRLDFEASYIPETAYTSTPVMLIPSS